MIWWLVVIVALALLGPAIYRAARRWWDRQVAEEMAIYVLAQGVDQVRWALYTASGEPEYESPEAREQFRQSVLRGYDELLVKYPERMRKHYRPTW